MPDPDAPSLAASGLVAGYLPGINILNGMSVEARTGQVRCILGPNGTGKSTLLKVLFGQLDRREGHVWRDGVPLDRVPSHRMGEHGITYLPQRPSVFPHLSVDANLRLGTWSFRRDRPRVAERIERAYQQFPILRQRHRQQAGTMSGGQQRQLEMARALLTDPVVMLIDEPTASIEPRVCGQIYALVAALAHEHAKAVLLVDQNIKGALGISDHVYVMRAGTLLEEGPRRAFEGHVEELVARWLYSR